MIKKKTRRVDGRVPVTFYMNQKVKQAFQVKCIQKEVKMQTLWDIWVAAFLAKP